MYVLFEEWCGQQQMNLSFWRQQRKTVRLNCCRKSSLRQHKIIKVNGEVIWKITCPIPIISSWVCVNLTLCTLLRSKPVHTVTSDIITTTNINITAMFILSSTVTFLDFTPDLYVFSFRHLLIFWFCKLTLLWRLTESSMAERQQTLFWSYTPCSYEL